MLRLLRIVLGVWAFAGVSLASAQEAGYWRTGVLTATGQFYVSGSPDSACSQYLAQANALVWTAAPRVLYSTFSADGVSRQCRFRRASNPESGSGATATSLTWITCSVGFEFDGTECVPEEEPPVCEPPGVLVNGQCYFPDPDPEDPQCEPPNVMIDGVCTRPGCPAGGSPAGNYNSETDTVGYLCEPYNGRSCGIVHRPNTCVRWNEGGPQTCSGPATWTGQSCMGPSGSAPGTSPGGNPGENPGTGPGGPGEGPGGPGEGPGDGTGGGPTNPNVPRPGPTLPQPDPQTPDEDGNCPSGSKRVNGSCIKDPTTPNSEGECPTGSTKVGEQCVFSSPPGNPNGTSSGDTGGGEGNGPGGGGGAGNCTPGSNQIRCATMGPSGDGDGDGIPRSEREITFSPENVLGASASCPASPNITLLTMGQNVTVIDMARACSFITGYVRPVAILLSAFFALGIAAGALRTDS